MLRKVIYLKPTQMKLYSSYSFIYEHYVGKIETIEYDKDDVTFAQFKSVAKGIRALNQAGYVILYVTSGILAFSVLHLFFVCCCNKIAKYNY